MIVVIALAASAYFYLSREKNKAGKNSIAVLPLVNASNDPNTEYLSDGISEALINSLTELQQLRVIARSTAFRYKGKDVDPQTVGRELNVQTVLMGRVRQNATDENPPREGDQPKDRQLTGLLSKLTIIFNLRDTA